MELSARMQVYGATLPEAKWQEVRGRRSFDGMGSSSSKIIAAQDDTDVVFIVLFLCVD